MNIICKLFGHKLKIARAIDPLFVYELKCQRCQNEYGYNSRVKALLPLDGELRYAHDVMLGIKP